MLTIPKKLVFFVLLILKEKRMTENNNFITLVNNSNNKENIERYFESLLFKDVGVVDKDKDLRESFDKLVSSTQFSAKEIDGKKMLRFFTFLHGTIDCVNKKYGGTNINTKELKLLINDAKSACPEETYYYQPWFNLTKDTLNWIESENNKKDITETVTEFDQKNKKSCFIC